MTIIMTWKLPPGTSIFLILLTVLLEKQISFASVTEVPPQNPLATQNVVVLNVIGKVIFVPVS